PGGVQHRHRGPRRQRSRRDRLAAVARPARPVPRPRRRPGRRFPLRARPGLSRLRFRRLSVSIQSLESPHALTDAAEWRRGAVIYPASPRSLAESTGAGVADLKGIADHLHHIASLGVAAVWISPFYTSPMRDFGYDVADYRGVDPIFGTMADFDA